MKNKTAASGKNRQKGRNSRSNTEIRVILYIFLGLFACMLVYFCYFVQFMAPKEINNSYNMRQSDLEDKVIRGSIYASDGEVLAEEALNSAGIEERYYPLGSLFAHVVGFSTHGKSGLENTANIQLLTSNAPVQERLAKEMAGKRNTGDNIYTTLNVNLQKTASEALGNYKGAIIVMEPKTGKVLAMVSKPDFDPNTVSENWADISDDDTNSPLVNRATQGLYPPGSTFKIVTLLEYLREHPDDYEDYSYNCTGTITDEDVTIECYHGSVHGRLNLMESFAKSCNCSFANIGLMLSIPEYEKTCEELLFNRNIPVDLSYSRSRFSLTSAASAEEKMQTAMGQGKTLITPMHMALITCAIANGGVMMKPYEIDKQENYLGTVVKSYSPEKYRTVMTSDEAALETKFMEEVIKSGTGKRLNGQPYSVAGKTGSAEYGSVKGQSHAWFTGFSNADDPDIEVTVIIEGAGSGGDYAVPVAKRIFDAYYGY